MREDVVIKTEPGTQSQNWQPLKSTPEVDAPSLHVQMQPYSNVEAKRYIWLTFLVMGPPPEEWDLQVSWYW